MINKHSKIYIAGHNGMVGSAILRRYRQEGYENIITKSSSELDLKNQNQVVKFFNDVKPEYVIIAAAKVGGILANNTYRAEFIYDNLMIEANVIHAAYMNDVEKLLFLGSSCIYPKLAPQPLKEEYLLSGYLEYTNEAYAIAKIAGIKLCENYFKQYRSNFFSVMPTNLYGPNDNFDLKTSHVLPALLRKIHEAKKKQNSEFRIQNLEKYQKDKNQEPSNNELSTVTVWGTGKPKREFLYVEDLADAVFYLMNKVDAEDLYDNGISHINIGTGEDLSISELVDIIKEVVGFEGEIKYDSTKPDGTPRKLLDVSRLHKLGWKHETSLGNGIRKTYEWYKENEHKFK